MRLPGIRRSLCLVMSLVLTLPLLAQDQDAVPSAEALRDAFPKKPYSPYAGRAYPTRPLWGDTHLHTAFSFDAGAFGCRLSPSDAYRFAKGEEVTSSTAGRARLSRPLDFLVVADHSDNMGFFPKLLSGDPTMLADETGRRWYDEIQAGGERGAKVALEAIDRFSKNTFPPALAVMPGSALYRSAWEQTIKAADEANAPGRFTAFIGYEWTSNTGGNNLHRVLVYRDGGDKAIRMEPLSTVPPAGSDNPRDLWKWMGTYEDKTGGRVLAIAHNGNLSNGIMFPLIESFTGKPIDREYAERRARFEPLYEATQIKGDGESHKFLSPTDEFASYEVWDKGNLNLSVAKKPEMLQYEYARSALKLGLKAEQELGINPYKFGMIGSTDSHTGLATAEEENFFGKHSACEPNPERWRHPVGCFSGVCIMGWEQAASGYAGGLGHREHPRVDLRGDATARGVRDDGPPHDRAFLRWVGLRARGRADPQPRGDRICQGRPDGRRPRAAPAGKVPTFLVAALKDPIGANLDRIQIVKGWLDAKGGTQEHVYDVAWSDDRKPGSDGKLPPVGTTVDIPNATWTNTIGDPELITVWKDPDFDAALRAFYYLRVIEIPTPRWTAYDAKRFGVKMGPEVPMTTQERAYSSPIWYTPKQ